MIEVLTASSGQKVIRRDGRLLASRIDPEGEARCWFQRRVAFASRVQTIFVLGAGSGFHIREILNKTGARVVVIDRDQELTDAVKQLGDFGPRTRFVIARSARELRLNEDVRSAVSGSFIVLEHPASLNADRDFFRECMVQLLGRDWGTLNWQWQLRGCASLDEQTKVAGNDAPLTIYDLEQTELVQDSAERERMLIKALRELVK